MAVTHSTLWDSVKELVLEQYKSSENLVGLIRTMVDECAQPLEDGAFVLQDALNIDDAHGEWLDVLGKLVGLKRYGGESDVDFKERIERAATNISAGTPDSVIYNSAIMSGDPKPAYIDEAPATFLVYTGDKPNRTVTEDSQETVEDFTEEERELGVAGGNQLLRRQVQQLAPAGVLGLPGAAIQFEDGTFMCDAQGRLILAAADDNTARRELLVVDNNLNPIVTPQGLPVRAVIVGATVPRVEIDYNGVTVDAVRIKDLPDAGEDNAYMVRDSDTGGTVRVPAMGENGLDELWDNTPAEE